MTRLPSTVQTFPLMRRDGKVYGRAVLSDGQRQVRVIAEGDPDLIERIYRCMAEPAELPVTGRCGGGSEVAELDRACLALLARVQSGDRVARDRLDTILRGSALGDDGCHTVYLALCRVVQAHPELAP